MIDFKKRSVEKEILDQENIPFEDIAQNMKELEWINRHLGGHSISIIGFEELWQKWRRQKASSNKSISVCEIGCGGGNNLKAINNYCGKKYIRSGFIGIDINKNCIEFARKNTSDKDFDYITSDYKKVSFEIKPDIIFSSLFCHHFSEEDLVQMMQWMKENSTIGFFINDLHRHSIAYHFIKTTTSIFSKSYLVKNDAPLSVLRGFRKKEWNQIFAKAGIKNFSLKWKWAFRHLIVVPNI
jgi:2-polyprenyl-3-methyl-5-hydroxy-6-metoxy-1,4-benzoquinol methylase